VNCSRSSNCTDFLKLQRDAIGFSNEPGDEAWRGRCLSCLSAADLVVTVPILFAHGRASRSVSQACFLPVYPPHSRSRTPRGELVGFAKITRDLTERRAACQRVSDLAADPSKRKLFAKLALHDRARGRA
jgi:hypothetical protein